MNVFLSSFVFEAASESIVTSLNSGVCHFCTNIIKIHCENSDCFETGFLTSSSHRVNVAVLKQIKDLKAPHSHMVYTFWMEST